MGLKEKIVKGFFKTKKDAIANAPTIMMAVSTICVVAGEFVTIYLADDIAEVGREFKRRKQEIKDVDNDPVGWSEMGETRKHYIHRMYKDTAVGYLKTAGPGLALTGVGVGFGWAAKEKLEDQKTALGIIAATKAAELAEYRQRVRDDVGEEKDQEYLTGMKKRSVVEVKDDGSVVEKTIMEPIDQEGESLMPDHSFWFDESNPSWTKSPAANYNFICGAIRSCNMILNRQGYIFENEIRDCFDSDRTVQGQYAGAVLEHTNDQGDKFTKRLRINPDYASRLINGEDPSAIIQIEYEDGTAISDDILTPEIRKGLGLRLI